MITHDLPSARLLAHITGRSLPIRATARFTRALPAIGIAPIRVAGDDRIQALAIGPLDRPPLILTLPAPFAVSQPALDRVGDVLSGYLYQDGDCQVWLPDQTSLAVLAIEGQRSRRNSRATTARQRLGICCYAIARLVQLSGQQHVAVGTTILTSHLICGQSPSEDAHLGALLAWAGPVPDAPPALVAAERRLQPGPSLLPFADDERVEALRSRIQKGTAITGDLVEIERILRVGALRAWDLVVQAHAVYHRLPLPPLPGMDELVGASRQELDWLLARSPAFGAHLDATRAEFHKREFRRAHLEDLEARGDAIIREALREEGRVVAATTLRVRTSRTPGQDTRILLATAQPVLRIRRGTKLKTRDGAVEAVVDQLRYRISSPTLILLRVTRGTRAARSLTIGGGGDWFDTVLFQGRQPGSGQTARLDAIPVAAAPVPQVPASGDLLRIARELRRL
jgi:hypothetical protein